MSVTILNERELRDCARIDERSLEAVERAFTWLAEGRVEMPPVMHIAIADEAGTTHRGDVDVKGAYVRSLDRLAVKIASGFFDNPTRGLPSSSAMMVVLNAHTGFCEAVLLDNGYLTDLRTGMAGAVAGRVLSPETVDTVGVFGAGTQARYQVQCLRLVRRFRRLLVRGRDAARVQRYVDDMRTLLTGIEVAEAANAETLVRESEVVITTTSSRKPIVRADWLHAGMHVTAMGSDLPGKQELAPEVLARADLVVCDRRSQCLEIGELQHARRAGLLEKLSIRELGELTGGHAAGREHAGQITVCDLTGVGVQDTAIAAFALERAAAQGLGTQV